MLKLTTLLSLMVICLTAVSAEVNSNTISNLLYLRTDIYGDRYAILNCTGFFAKYNGKIVHFTAHHCFERPHPHENDSPFEVYIGATDFERTYSRWGDRVTERMYPVGYSSVSSIRPSESTQLENKDASYTVMSWWQRQKLGSMKVFNISKKLPQNGETLYSLAFPNKYPIEFTCKYWGIRPTPVSEQNPNLQLSIVCRPDVGINFTGASGAPLINNLGEVVGLIHRDGGSVIYATPLFPIENHDANSERLIIFNNNLSPIASKICFDKVGTPISGYAKLVRSDLISHYSMTPFGDWSPMDEYEISKIFKKNNEINCNNEME